MDILSLIKSRRSIREFKEENVPDEIINKLLESAIYAPSEGNLQPWKFYVVRDRKIRIKLAESALEQYFISQAPVAIVVCADLIATSPYGSRGINLYCIQSTAAAIQNILLTAHSFGLGTCWVGAFDEEQVSKILNLPGSLRPVAIIPVGYPAEKPHTPYRKKIKDVTEFI
jgi:nitroreductase